MSIFFCNYTSGMMDHKIRISILIAQLFYVETINVFVNKNLITYLFLLIS